MPPAALEEELAPNTGSAPFQLRFVKHVPEIPSATKRPPASLQVSVKVAASLTLKAVLPREIVPVLPAPAKVRLKAVDLATAPVVVVK